MTRSAPYCPQCGQPTQMRLVFGRERPVCTACGHTVFFDPKVAVAVLITRAGSADNGAEILLVQRGNDPGKGLWSVPAGFMDYDEDPQSAAVRETFEETGLTIQIAHLIAVLHRPDPDGLADLVLIYRGALADPQTDPYPGDDTVATAWFTGEAIPELAFASTRLLVQRWRAGDFDRIDAIGTLD